MKYLFLPSVQGRKQGLRRLLCVCFTLFLLSALLLSYFLNRLSPALYDMALQEAKNRAVYAVDTALKELLSEGESPVKTNFDARGRLTLITCDSALNGRIRFAASEAIGRLLEGDSSTIRIPLGSLLDSPLTMGRGPKISVHVVPLSTAVVRLKDSFTTAGINQTLFTLSCEITVEISLVAALDRKTDTLVLSSPVTQMVIAGDVPEVYVGA